MLALIPGLLGWLSPSGLLLNSHLGDGGQVSGDMETHYS